MKSFEIWRTFLNGYKKAKNCSLKEAMQDCGKNGGIFEQWKKSTDAQTESDIKESINDFLNQMF